MDPAYSNPYLSIDAVLAVLGTRLIPRPTLGRRCAGVSMLTPEDGGMSLDCRLGGGLSANAESRGSSREVRPLPGV
jgi:hypothetical protein